MWCNCLDNNYTTYYDKLKKRWCKMGLEANIVYLDEEIVNLQERISVIRSFLQVNPLASIYRRSIRGKNYYYKKYRIGEKSISKFLGSGDFDFKEASRKLKAENEKVKRAKGQLAKLKKEMFALKKQAKIARKAFEHVRV
jgi:hypothetical protein